MPEQVLAIVVIGLPIAIIALGIMLITPASEGAPSRFDVIMSRMTAFYDSLPRPEKRVLSEVDTAIIPHQDAVSGDMGDDTGIVASRRLSDTSIIIFLALQKGTKEKPGEQSGGYRFSANAIYALVKGNSNTVKAMIRELRGATFLPLDEQGRITVQKEEK